MTINWQKRILLWSKRCSWKSILLYCIIQYIVPGARHVHQDWLPSVKMYAACNANMTKIWLLIFAFWFSSWGIKVRALMCSICTCKYLFVCQRERRLQKKDVYLSKYWPVRYSRHNVNGKCAQESCTCLSRCCWHCNVQRLPDLSSQSSLTELELPEEAEEGSYLKNKNRPSWWYTRNS